MQRSIWIVLLPLFLVLLIAVSWVSCCDSADIGNSVRSNFGSALNSVYKRSSTKIRKRRQQISLGSFWKRPVKELDDAAVKVQKVLYIELEETLQIVQWWLRRFSSWD
ncbi:uncharacterized protein LOC133728473 [Rosa rugosa]|uniref:uncharacterized protein LOC133728473 n=1 Tax=Rosa rugosa TaxID=74645 RepID=UPI002B4076C4|nr:uncharacterized protein LOC133728473 [Rosa rugosa]